MVFRKELSLSLALHEFSKNLPSSVGPSSTTHTTRMNTGCPDWKGSTCISLGEKKVKRKKKGRKCPLNVEFGFWQKKVRKYRHFFAMVIKIGRSNRRSRKLHVDMNARGPKRGTKFCCRVECPLFAEKEFALWLLKSNYWEEGVCSNELFLTETEYVLRI